MAFETTKREWSELYAFFYLLSHGKVSVGDSQGKSTEREIPIAYIQREEHDGSRQYIIGAEHIHLIGENIDKEVSRELFRGAAQLILEALKEAKDNDVLAPDGIEEFLDDVCIFNLEAQTEDRTDFSIAFYDTHVPLVGFCVRSKLGTMIPLLDGGRTANLKFEQTGIKFATPTVNKVNALETTNGVADRMLLIERLGGVLKYADVHDKVFRSNLSMIDLHFPRLLAEMLRVLHLDGVTRTAELIDVMKQTNPLKIKEELISKHHFYEFKMKQFLLTLAYGMRPAKIYNGTDSAVEGMLLVDGQGEVICYHKNDESTFADFLFLNTRFEKSSVEKDKYGFLERENGVYYFRLNAKISLMKR